MRYYEFIGEGRNRKPLRKSSQRALPNMTQYDTLDNNNHPYLAYRFGVAMASSPNGDMDKQGPIGSNFHTIDYTKGDAEIRQGAEKIMGISSSRSTGPGSEELKTANIVSIVPTISKNKFGV